MEWFTLVSTAVGAVLGIGATTINEQFKWRRERSKALYEARTKLYSDFLADLTITRDAVHAAGRGFHPLEMSRHQAADEAFRRANLYSRRWQMSITAPDPVVAAATTAFRSLRAVRNVVAEGADTDSPEYNAVRTEYESELRTLTSAMRDDLAPVTSVPGRANGLSDTKT